MITKFPDIAIALPWRARMIPFAHRRIAPKLDSKTEIKHPCYNPPFWPRGIIGDLWVVVNAFATLPCRTGALHSWAFSLCASPRGGFI